MNTMDASLLGKPSLLVAAPQLQDPNFARAVLLLVEHSDMGAFGLIINRPTEIPVSSLLQGDYRKLPVEVPAWTGGPVGTDNGLILCKTLPYPPEEHEILADGVFLTSSEKALAALASHAAGFARGLPDNEDTPNHPYRFLVGYAGWGPGQLDTELRHGSWIELPIDFELMYYTPWQRMWQAAIGGLGIHPATIAPSIQEYLN